MLAVKIARQMAIPWWIRHWELILLTRTVLPPQTPQSSWYYVFPHLELFLILSRRGESDSDAGNTSLKISASDLADCRAENWLLKKKLAEYEVTIENLEQLVSTIVEKQHQILSEMFHLRKENRELQSECHMQREYHSMERNALMRELHDLRTVPRNRRLALVSPPCSLWNEKNDKEP